MVLADGGRGLVQEVAAGVADMSVDALDAGLRLLPVTTELHLAAHRTLIAAQPDLDEAIVGMGRGQLIEVVADIFEFAA